MASSTVVAKLSFVSCLTFILWSYSLCRLYSGMSLTSFYQMMCTSGAMEGSVVSFILCKCCVSILAPWMFLVFVFQEITLFYQFKIIYILLMQLLLLSCPGGLGAYWLTNLTPKKMSLMQSLPPLLFLGKIELSCSFSNCIYICVFLQELDDCLVLIPDT